MTTSPEPAEHEYAKEPPPAFAKGRLMAIDWADGTARLDTPMGDSVMLRFSVSDIDMENNMRKLTTCHVEVRGRVSVISDNRDQEYINVEDIDHALLEPEAPMEPKDGPISEEEMEEFIRVIREGRDGLCGECWRRAAAA